MSDEEQAPTPNDWMYEKMPDVKGPAPRVLYRGPDAMRPDSGEGGYGRAFIYFPDGHLAWSQTTGHESMLSDRDPDKLMDLLSHAFSPHELAALAQETTYQGQPWYEDRILRLRTQERALFGRVGTVSGFEMLSLWPGTANFTIMLPKLVDLFLKQSNINSKTLITVGREARYTVGQFLQKQGEVTAKLSDASDKLGELLQGGDRRFVRGQEDAENMANPLRTGEQHPTGGEHPMASAMKQAGTLGPGQKWWAPTSESSFKDYVQRRDEETL